MLLNSEESHYICTGNNCADDMLLHNGEKFKSSKETLLRIAIDNKLSFDSHINRICKKAGQNLSALSQISAFTDLNKR